MWVIVENVSHQSKSESSERVSHQNECESSESFRVTGMSESSESSSEWMWIVKRECKSLEWMWVTRKTASHQSECESSKWLESSEWSSEWMWIIGENVIVGENVSHLSECESSKLMWVAGVKMSQQSDSRSTEWLSHQSNRRCECESCEWMCVIEECESLGANLSHQN